MDKRNRVSWIRTGKIGRERTKSGIIHTAQECTKPKEGQKGRYRWVYVGYTSTNNQGETNR